MRSIGVGVFVMKGDKILIGRRGPLCKRGSGCYALLGGTVEDGETVTDCAVRESLEEADLVVLPSGSAPARNDWLSIPGLLAVTDHMDPEHREELRMRHLSLWVMGRWISGEPRVMEPGKCEGWDWLTLEQVAEIPGVWDRETEQFYWIPMPLWGEILKDELGERRCGSILAAYQHRET